MSVARNVRKNFNLFVDGQGYAGQIENFTPPVLKVLTEETRLAGMDGPIDLDMGIEKLTAGFEMISYDRDVLALFGLRVGGGIVPVTARELLESFDGTATGVVHTMRGKVVEMDGGTVSPGTKTPLKVGLSLIYYKQTIDGETVHEIDLETSKRVIGGVDQNANQRRILQL